MGLFFGSTNKASGFNKYRQIGRMEGEKILKSMNERDRGKLKGYVKGLGAGRKSLAAVSEAVKKEHGHIVKNKFLKAAEKFYGGGLTGEEKKRNLQLGLRLRVAEEMGSEDLSRNKILSQARGGAKGTAASIGVNTLKSSTSVFSNKSNGSASIAKGGVPAKSGPSPRPSGLTRVTGGQASRGAGGIKLAV